jgi:hypothetical protein
MSRLVNNREILYFQTAVLTEPIFFSTKRNQTKPTTWVCYRNRTEPLKARFVKKSMRVLYHDFS